MGVNRHPVINPPSDSRPIAILRDGKPWVRGYYDLGQWWSGGFPVHGVIGWVDPEEQADEAKAERSLGSSPYRMYGQVRG